MQVNPIQLIDQIRRGQNPQQLMLFVLENQMKGTPNRRIAKRFHIEILTIQKVSTRTLDMLL